MSISLPISDAFFEALARRTAEISEQQVRAKFITKEALAYHYGVSVRTIKTWRQKGLPGHAVGREIMFSIEEADRWISRHPDRPDREVRG